MGELLYFEGSSSKDRFVGRIMSQLNDLNEKAIANIGDFYSVLQENPEQAVLALPEYIQRARETGGPEAIVYESLAGGANHDWTGPIIDAIGIVYPTLPKEARKKVVVDISTFLKGQRYDVGQRNLEMLNDPWLFTDITINHSLYWPGYEEYIQLVEECEDWSQLYKRFGEVQSAFLMAYMMSRVKYAPREFRHNFYALFPKFMDRTTDAIAARVTVSAENAYLEEGIPVEESIEGKMFKYDHVLVPAIREKVAERKWIDLDEPVYVKVGERNDGGSEYDVRYRSEIWNADDDV